MQCLPSLQLRHLEIFCFPRHLGVELRSIVVFVLSAVLAFTFAASFSAPANVMLIGTAVAFNAVVEVADAFFDMLAANAGKRIFVTAVTGVTAVIVAHMASCTARIVVVIQHEKLVVVECRRNPFLLSVALAAISADLFS